MDATFSWLNSLNMYSNIKHILFIVLYLAVHLIGLGSADDEVVNYNSIMFRYLIWKLTLRKLDEFCWPCFFPFNLWLIWQIKYDIQFDRVESFNGTDKFYKFQLNMTKKEDSKNLFTVDGSLELLQDFDDDWKVWTEIKLIKIFDF